MTIESTRSLASLESFLGARRGGGRARLLCVACSGSSRRICARTATVGSSPRPPSTTPPARRRPVRRCRARPPPSARSASWSSPQSIDATGRADDTKALQAFLNRVPNGRVIQFRRGGRYRVDGTLFLRNRHDLTIDGDGATVFATTRGGRNRAQWWIKDGSQIVFRNLSVQGANPHGGVGEDAYVAEAGDPSTGSASRVSTAPSSTTCASPTCTATSCTSAATSTRCRRATSGSTTRRSSATAGRASRSRPRPT